jgi:hypothetical protein
MKMMRSMIWTLSRLCVCLLACGLCGCVSFASLKPGKMEWVQPQSQAPHAGSVYLVRGWVGMFSKGIDQLGRKLNGVGVTARVFQHDQCHELAQAMVERYKAAKDPEPICMIGHSFGSDDALIIARELDKAGVPVELIVTLDCVNESVVPKNVKLCYNFWQKGMFGSSNFLRGIPLTQQPGCTGRLVNVNLYEEGRYLRDSSTNHITIDEAPKLHQAIIEHVLSACPPRATWAAMHRESDIAKSVVAPSTSEGARTARATSIGERPLEAGAGHKLSPAH